MPRRRFQFRLTQLVVLTALIAIPLSLYHHYLNDQPYGMKPMGGGPCGTINPELRLIIKGPCVDRLDIEDL